MSERPLDYETMDVDPYRIRKRRVARAFLVAATVSGPFSLMLGTFVGLLTREPAEGLLLSGFGYLLMMSLLALGLQKSERCGGVDRVRRVAILAAILESVLMALVMVFLFLSLVSNVSSGDFL